MAVRRLVDELSGDTFRVTVDPGTGSWTIQRVGDDAICGGEFYGPVGRLKLGGGVAELSEGVTLRYGIFRTRTDIAAGYLLRIRTAEMRADLFLTPAVADWLTGDPEEEHRRLQELRPAHRYGSHVSHLVSLVG